MMDVSTPAWDISYKLLQTRPLESKDKLDFEIIFNDESFNLYDTLDIWIMLKKQQFIRGFRRYCTPIHIINRHNE